MFYLKVDMDIVVIMTDNPKISIATLMIVTFSPTPNKHIPR